MGVSFNIGKLEEILKKNPTDFATNLTLQSIYMEAHEYEKAKRPLSTLIPIMRKNIEHAEVTNKSEISVISVLKPATYSLQIYKKIFKINLESLAICHMELGDHESALPYQEECLKVDDDDPDSWNLYGVIWSRMHHGYNAQNAFLSALIRNPLHKNSWTNLEREYGVKQNMSKAEQIGHILPSRDNLDDAISQLARVFFLRVEFDKLFELMQKHPMKHLLNDEILEILYQVSMLDERYSTVEKILKIQISRNQNDTEFRWRLARAYALQEKTEQSLKIIESFSKEDPQYSASVLLQDALNNKAHPVQLVKACVRYDNGYYDRITFQYMSEIKVGLGTSVGDLMQTLVSGYISKISHLNRIPGVYYVFFLKLRNISCVPLGWNLFEIRGDYPHSYSVRFDKSKVPRASRTANFSDILLDGDVLLIGKKPTSIVPDAYIHSAALISGPAMKEMEDVANRAPLPSGSKDRGRNPPSKDVSRSYDTFVDEFLAEFEKKLS